MKKLLLLLFLVFSLTISAQPYPSDPDKDILFQIWTSFNQPDLEGWNFDPNVELNNDWQGIIMTDDGVHIEEIKFSAFQLNGTISPAFGQLSQLTNLDLPYNNLTGGIPSELGDLSTLIFLDINHNMLTGNIPEELGNLENLSELDLGYNQLTGGIPGELGSLSNIGGIFLNNNNLSGSIPSELGDLNNLQLLSLGFNQLTGNIPEELGGLTLLQGIILESNLLEGCIPASFEYYCSSIAPNNISLDQNPFLDNDDFSTFCSDNIGNCCSHPDLDALLALYNSTDGANWEVNTGWAEGAAGLDCEPCNWAGVLCNSDDRVIHISLASNGLTGTLPPEIGNLTFLERLNLSQNDISGEIPLEIGSLDYLERIYLHNNALTGNIPSEIGGLSALNRLYLNNNSLSGTIPIELGDLSALLFLDLHENQLSGNIPEELANLSNLTLLWLNDNELTGCIPYTFLAFCPINDIDLSNNPLENDDFSDFCNGDVAGLVALYNSTDGPNWGINTIPGFNSGWLDGSICPCEWLGVICNNEGRVEGLSMPAFGLSGTIPPELGTISNMVYINFSNNPLLTGEIPAEIGNLSELTHFMLISCNLTGSLLPELGALDNLYYWDINNNQISGSIPPELGDLSSLALWVASNNQLTGGIPEELGNLNSLVSVSLAYNQLDGEISEDLAADGNLTSIHIMVLAFNELTGNIPQSLVNHSTLDELYLRNNQLSGELPEVDYPGGVPIMYLQNNQLTGCIPLSYQSYCLTNAPIVLTNNPLDNDNFYTFCSDNLGTCCGPTDLNDDGLTNGEDFSIFQGNWMVECDPNLPCPTDFNNDGITNGEDFGIFLSNWMIICP